MAAIEPGKIRNVAVVGHRGTGKTSLVEALLFQTDEINRLGAIDAGTTVSDWDEDEQKRQMSISLTLAHTTLAGPQDQPARRAGRPELPGRGSVRAAGRRGRARRRQRRDGARGRHRAREAPRRRARARARAVRQHARPRARRLLPHARRRSRSSSRRAASRCTCRSAPSTSSRGIVDVLHMCAYTSPDGGKEGEPIAIPAEMVDLAQEYREKLLDEVVQTDEALMEQYLGGEELDPHAVASALKLAITRGEVFPVACGVATKNLGTHALLDLIVEGVPSPAKKGAPIEIEGADTAAFVFKTLADPFAGRINLFRVLQGRRHRRLDARRRARPREGADGNAAAAAGQGQHGREGVRRGRHRRRRQAQGRAHRRPAHRSRDRRRAARDRLPRAGDELRDHAACQRARRRRSRRRSAGSPRRTRRCGSAATSRPGRRSSRG